jgi:hypothetical protein
MDVVAGTSESAGAKKPGYLRWLKSVTHRRRGFAAADVSLKTPPYRTRVFVGAAMPTTAE